MCSILKLLIIGLMSTFALAKSNNMTLMQKMRDHPDLSMFYALIERNEFTVTLFKQRSLTVFAPTNQAFQKHKDNKAFVLYHLCNVLRTLDELESTISTEFDGHPVLYITKKNNPTDDIYVNNALVLRSESNIKLVNEAGSEQILHIIDDILIPVSGTPRSAVSNPDALQFMNQFESVADIGPHRVRLYRQQVKTLKKNPVFQAEGWHTYFIPVDEGFNVSGSSMRSNLIDSEVIDGHIIPRLALFTSSVPLEEPFATMAFEDNLKVEISFFTQNEGKTVKTYVKSNTKIGGPRHPDGVVMAEIVKGNIPVKNGVIHLIQRPLMVVDTNVKQFFEEKEDGPVNKFFKIVSDYGDDFMTEINQLPDVTVFAPSNEAWSDPNLNKILSNKAKMKEILKLHVVNDRLTTDKIRHSNYNQIIQVPTIAARKFLYFNIISNQTVTVEGGGVNATIIQADIAATNGIVHIINRVLGVPYTTVYDKLRTDPMMNETFHLGIQPKFNEQLKDDTKRFTYFVPRDRAWQESEKELPSTNKVLFMPEFSYYAAKILERHLVIADKPYTMADLRVLSNNSVPLPTVRDSVQILVKEEDKRYFIYWNNKWIHVFRPDVECTNGIIHVIDRPFLSPSDVTLTRNAAFNIYNSREILLYIINVIFFVASQIFV